MQMTTETLQRVHSMTFATVYPLYIAKVERKGKTKAELDTIIYWLTGYDETGLQEQIKNNTSFKDFFDNAPQFNEKSKFITGVICGDRVEDLEDEIFRKVRYLDKLVDELAKGKAMTKILRTQNS